MLVTCSACSAKFQLPDEKIRGRKARMKCKTCGASISIDGMSLSPAAAHGPPPPPSRRPAATAKPEVLTFTDQTVALGPGEAEALSRQAREAERAVAPDLEDRITPVSTPLSAPAPLLDDGYVDAAMDALEQKVFSVPAPRPPAPSSAAKTKTKAQSEDEEATRMMDLPRLLSGQPPAPTPAGPKSAAPDGDGEEATRMMDLGGPSGLLGSVGPRPADKDGEEATRIFDAEPAPHGPRLPPRPSLPRAPGAPPATPSAPAPLGSSPVAGAAAKVEPPVVVSDPAPAKTSVNPLEVVTSKVEVQAIATAALAGPSSPLLGEALTSPPAARSAPESKGQRPKADLTVQRARISSTPPPPPSSNWGLYLFIAAVAATGSLVGLFFFSRPTFDAAIASTRQALGLSSAAETDGPAFNAGAAAEELARIAARAPSCKQPGGPVGAGRARVLFQMDGRASSAAVSPPFHASPSETCLIGLFKSARVPAFGGQPVIVTKTFRVD